MSNLVKTQEDNNEDSSDSEGEDDDEEKNESARPVMHYSILKHLGCVNRVRVSTI